MTLTIAAAIFNGLWEGALIVGCVWLGLRWLPKRSAATSYAVWLLALAALVLIPAFTVSFSKQPVAPADATVAGQQIQPAPSVQELVATPAGAPALANGTSSSAQQRRQISIPQSFALAAALAWIIIVLARSLMLLRNAASLASIRRSAEFWTRTHGYPVYLSDRVEVPIAVGFSHPAIVLPARLIQELDEAALQSILIHEVAHLQRFDVWTNAFARIAEVFTAFNPAAWFIMRRLSVEREIACDDWVVAHTGAGDTFARALAKLAGRARGPAPIAAPSAMGSPHSIVVRIERLLDSRPRTLRLSRPALGGALMLLALIAFTLQSISPVLAFAPQALEPSQISPVVLASNCSKDVGPTRNHELGAGGPRMGSPSLPQRTLNDIVARYPATTTTFRVQVDASGHPHDLTILHHSQVDKQTVEEVMASTFQPARHNCAAMAGTFSSAITKLPAPTVFVMTRPGIAGPRVTAAAPKPAAGCAVPHLYAKVKHLVKPDITDAMAKVIDSTQRTYLNLVTVQISASGAVTSAVVDKSSGNKVFDDAAVAAADRTTYSARVVNCKPVPSTQIIMTAFTGWLKP